MEGKRNTKTISRKRENEAKKVIKFSFARKKQKFKNFLDEVFGFREAPFYD
jgi:hypothetical protein